jgi:hypothetical protein
MEILLTMLILELFMYLEGVDMKQYILLTLQGL